MGKRVLGFSWELIAEAESWALRVGAIVAGVALLLLRDPMFAWASLTAVCWEVGFVHFVTGYARRALDAGIEPRLEAAMLILGRLAGKVMLLVVPVLLPGIFNQFGMIVGMLVYDTTLIVLTATRSSRLRQATDIDSAS